MMVEFIVGMFIGGAIGVIVMALVNCGKED